MGTRVYVRAQNWSVAAQRVEDWVGDKLVFERPPVNDSDRVFVRTEIENYEKNGDPNKNRLEFAAFVATRANLDEDLEDILRCGIDPNARNGFEDTLLMAAARSGSAECAQVLLRFGADPSLPSPGGTAQEIAEKVGDKKIAAMIADHVQKESMKSDIIYRGYPEDDSGGDDDSDSDHRVNSPSE